MYKYSTESEYLAVKVQNRYLKKVLQVILMQSQGWKITAIVVAMFAEEKRYTYKKQGEEEEEEVKELEEEQEEEEQEEREEQLP